MSLNRSSVLIAEPAKLASDLKAALPLDRVHVVTACTFEGAVDLAEHVHPEIYIIGYHFDEMRPYRLIQHIRGMPWGAGAKILMVRALPLQKRSKEEEQTRDAYMSIGADDYLVLYDDAERSQVFNPLRRAIEKLVKPE